MTRYSEGILGDGAAILDYGCPITIDNIVKLLNDASKNSARLKCCNDMLQVIKRAALRGTECATIEGAGQCFTEIIACVDAIETFSKTVEDDDD